MTARDEFAVIITALMAGKIDGPQALAACVAQHERASDSQTDGLPAVVEAINGLTYAVMALVAVTKED